MLNNGATPTYACNATGQVTRLLNKIGPTTISDFSSIGYDGADNRTTATVTLPSDEMDRINVTLIKTASGWRINKVACAN